MQLPCQAFPGSFLNPTCEHKVSQIRSEYKTVCSQSAMHVGLDTPAEVDVICLAGTTAVFAIRSGYRAAETTISEHADILLLHLTCSCAGARHID